MKIWWRSGWLKGDIQIGYCGPVVYAPHTLLSTIWQTMSQIGDASLTMAQIWLMTTRPSILFMYFFIFWNVKIWMTSFQMYVPVPRTISHSLATDGKLKWWNDEIVKNIKGYLVKWSRISLGNCVLLLWLKEQWLDQDQNHQHRSANSVFDPSKHFAFKGQSKNGG